MGKEILAVPEDNLEEVIRIIEAGLERYGEFVSDNTRHNLEKWCRGS